MGKKISLKKKLENFPKLKQDMFQNWTGPWGIPRQWVKSSPHTHPFEILGYYALWDFQKYVELHNGSYGGRGGGPGGVESEIPEDWGRINEGKVTAKWETKGNTIGNFRIKSNLYENAKAQI